ncbi:hypothetical protein DFH07DRAFT_989568 [Mycena maculata]|uniref:Uncharacterized protein n=1 Tax=Mycena maculata TaxID=230809 RepID=A0AAD7I2Q9_9AGAR|nr:hypothetical protein DFH07DRAFT_989568 [Mycena maculata]
MGATLRMNQGHIVLARRHANETHGQVSTDSERQHLEFRIRMQGYRLLFLEFLPYRQGACGGEKGLRGAGDLTASSACKLHVDRGTELANRLGIEDSIVWVNCSLEGLAEIFAVPQNNRRPEFVGRQIIPSLTKNVSAKRPRSDPLSTETGRKIVRERKRKQLTKKDEKKYVCRAEGKRRKHVPHDVLVRSPDRLFRNFRTTFAHFCTFLHTFATIRMNARDLSSLRVLLE